MDEQATLLILAGGASTRLGFPKSQLSLGSSSVLQVLQERLESLFSETIIVGGRVELPSARRIDDLLPEMGPLGGIHAGLLAARSELCFVLACDMPFVRPSVVRLLLQRCREAHVAVPYVMGFYEPLCAAYRTSAAPVAIELLRQRRLQVNLMYSQLTVRKVTESELRRLDPSLSSFVNINTEADLQREGLL